MADDANNPALQLFCIVGDFAWVGGCRQRQQWPAVAQQCHGGGEGRTMLSFWCLQRQHLVYCWIFGKGGGRG
eukprot:288482-Ditylum_brightwellii.AAC.1